MSLENIGRYQIVGELGKGAMGVVYRATDPTIGRTVALKTMRLDVHGMDTEEMLKRFRNEARAAGVLNHPNIVTVYDAGEQEGLFYMALELIEGRSLHALLVEQRVLPVEQIIDFSRQVCAGLDYAQSHGVIHRDIKPANIMITPDQTVKIMDFGIAKAGGGMTSVGQVLGTPNYMSPEQVKGRPLDGRSDLFGWGVILYEMVTGEKPFTGQNVTTIIYKIVNENPIPPRELDVTIHPGLNAVVMKALAKLPDERYQRGADLVRDLQNYKTLGAPAEPTSVLPAVPERAEKTAAPPAMASKRTPAPAAPASTTKPAAAAPAKKAAVAIPGVPQKLLLPLGAAALVLLLAIAGLAWYRHRAPAQQPQSTAAVTQPVTQPSVPPPASSQTTSAPAPGSQADTAPADATEAQPAGKPARHPRIDASPPAIVPATADATTGDLDLTSSPDGASVQIDGRSSSTWLTPYTATGLSSGTHSISFAKPGYVPVTRSVEVVAGQTTPINVRLAVVTNTIGVTSDPAGAAIFVDGKDTGKVTPAQVAVTLGEHKLLLRKAGYKDATTTVARIRPGDTYNYAPTLEPGSEKAESKESSHLINRIFGGIPEGKGALDVKSNPKGAQIAIAGMADTHATPHKYFLNPGNYQVTLKLDGYKTVKKSVTVEKGKGLEMSETLQKQ